MLGLQVRRHGSRVRRLVISRFVKSDGKRFHRALANRLHQRNHSARIHSAGEERSQRNVRNHAKPNGVEQEAVQFLDRRFIGHVQEVALAAEDNLFARPIAAHFRLTVR